MCDLFVCPVPAPAPPSQLAADSPPPAAPTAVQGIGNMKTCFQRMTKWRHINSFSYTISDLPEHLVHPSHCVWPDGVQQEEDKWPPAPKFLWTPRSPCLPESGVSWAWTACPRRRRIVMLSRRNEVQNNSPMKARLLLLLRQCQLCGPEACSMSPPPSDCCWWKMKVLQLPFYLSFHWPERKQKNRH